MSRSNHIVPAPCAWADCPCVPACGLASWWSEADGELWYCHDDACPSNERHAGNLTCYERREMQTMQGIAIWTEDEQETQG